MVGDWRDPLAVQHREEKDFLAELPVEGDPKLVRLRARASYQGFSKNLWE